MTTPTFVIGSTTWWIARRRRLRGVRHGAHRMIAVELTHAELEAELDEKIAQTWVMIVRGDTLYSRQPDGTYLRHPPYPEPQEAAA